MSIVSVLLPTSLNDQHHIRAVCELVTNVKRAIQTADAIHAGTVGIAKYNKSSPQVPFGGFKQSGMGRESEEYALSNYTQVKAVRLL